MFGSLFQDLDTSGTGLSRRGASEADDASNGSVSAGGIAPMRAAAAHLHGSLALRDVLRVAVAIANFANYGTARAMAPGVRTSVETDHWFGFGYERP